GVALEVSPEQRTVKWPIRFRVGGRVDSDEGSAARDEAFECGLFGIAEDIARRAQENDPRKRSQACVGEALGPLRRADRNSLLGAEIRDNLDALLDGGMSIPGGLCEEQELGRASGSPAAPATIARGIVGLVGRTGAREPD